VLQHYTKPGIFGKVYIIVNYIDECLLLTISLRILRTTIQ